MNGPLEYSWTSFPAKDNIMKSIFAILVIAAISTVIYIVYHSSGWAIFAALVLVLSLRRFFFTNYFSIGTDGVSVAYLFGKKFLPWDRIKTFKSGETGAYLSPMRSVSRWSINRGIFLIYSPDEKEKIENIILSGVRRYGTG